MTLVAQRWNNPWHGRAAEAAIQRTLEDGYLGPPSGVRRAGRRHCGPHRDVVGIHAVGPGRRGVHLACRRSSHVGGVLLVPARASRATTWVLVDAVHAHSRHGPRPVVGPAVLTPPLFAVASAVRQSPPCRPDRDVPTPGGHWVSHIAVSRAYRTTPREGPATQAKSAFGCVDPAISTRATSAHVAGRVASRAAIQVAGGSGRRSASVAGPRLSDTPTAQHRSWRARPANVRIDRVRDAVGR